MKKIQDEIFYLSGSEYPSSFANSVQVVKQANGMGNICSQITILARRRYKSDDDIHQITSDYGLASNVNLLLMDVARYLPRYFASILYPFWCIFQIPRNVSIVYGRHLLSLLLVALFQRRPRIIFECHAPPRGIYRLLLRMFSRTGRLDRIVVISEALKKLLLAKVSSVREINMAVAHDACEPPKECNSNQSDFSIGYVGGFLHGRGLDLIALLAVKFPDVKFHLIGGNDDDFVFFSGMPKPNNVTCYGRVPQSEIHKYYDLFTVALAPYSKTVLVPDGTNTAEYMSPLKIFEYMGWGKAIIASDLPVVSEILTNGKNALLAAPDDIDQWTSAIEQLKDFNLRFHIGLRARRDALEFHTWVRRAAHVLKLD
jgi:glycosyltransferase involved in cell wall biosynthesis